MVFHAIILAAGYGTRLGEIAQQKPKALLPIGTTTILDLTLRHILAVPGIGAQALVSNDTFAAQFKAWAQQQTVTVLNNGVTQKADIKGAIKDAWRGIQHMNWESSDVLIIGSDNFLQESLVPAATQFINEPYSVVVVSDYGSKERVKRMGVPTVDKDGFVVEYNEKPTAPKTTLAGALIFFIKAQDLGELRRLAAGEKDNIGHFLEVLAAKKRLKAYVTRLPFLDIGTPEDYYRAQELIANP